jgi:hypothetical protein
MTTPRAPTGSTKIPDSAAPWGEKVANQRDHRSGTDRPEGAVRDALHTRQSTHGCGDAVLHASRRVKQPADPAPKTPRRLAHPPQYSRTWRTPPFPRTGLFVKLESLRHDRRLTEWEKQPERLGARRAQRSTRSGRERTTQAPWREPLVVPTDSTKNPDSAAPWDKKVANQRDHRSGAYCPEGTVRRGPRRVKQPADPAPRTPRRFAHPPQYSRTWRTPLFPQAGFFEKLESLRHDRRLTEWEKQPERLGARRAQRSTRSGKERTTQAPWREPPVVPQNGRHETGHGTPQPPRR